MAGNSGKDKVVRRRGRTAIAWLLIAVIVAASGAVGACALWLPDRAPELLGSAKEVTSAPVNVQQYAGSQQVTVVPTVSATRDLIGNATGTVTGDWSSEGLTSGRTAMKVNDRYIVALSTATPLYRNLKTGDKGDDVLALNDELNRLGYNSAPGSNIFWWATSDGLRQLMNDNGNNSDGTLSISDILWIPAASVRVGSWTAIEGTSVQAGTAVGQIPGTLTQLTIKNGQSSEQDRTITILGQTTTLPAGQTSITDAAFCDQVAATDDYRGMDAGTLAAGIGATVTLGEPIQVLRVPAAAVFGVNGTQGCIATTDGTNVTVSIVGSELGASLVQPADGTDASAITGVMLGKSLSGRQCQ
ncbi:hypothetical protein [Bifidobacterium biavatii]|uniref:Peptidoglycan-binding domain 1 protein n=1 Tax=Bifidobacterium biavatii DSM 23969 TaxID=1437608 RepID=A0A086ZYL7_9BIFI|nr:hypothetical protein [Bifidobacterium biavatii]KFI51617.1 hypothetical protein BBIA_1643 [Bifidobacterium biavatii DSM 23969]